MTAALLVMAAGLIYLVMAPHHWEHAAAHGLFVGSAGFAQVGWSLAYARTQSRLLQRAGLVLAGGTVTLWLLATLLPLPPEGEREAADILGVTATMLEGLAVLNLLPGTEDDRRRGIPAPIWHAVGVPLAIILVVGGTLFGAGVPFESVEHHQHDAAASAAAGPSAGASADTVELVVAGIPQPVSAESEIPVVGDVLANIAIEPGTSGKQFARTLDLALSRSLASNTPVDGATVQVTAQMRYMDHGTFRVMAVPGDDGHYVASLQFPMPDEWQLDVQVIVPGQSPVTLTLNVDLLS